MSSDEEKEEDDDDDKEVVDGPDRLVGLDCFSCCWSSCLATDDEEVEEARDRWVGIVVGGVSVRA
jgi:hypothetical protein